MNHMYRALRTSHQRDISTTALLRMALLCIKRNYCSSKDTSELQLSQGQDILLQNMRSATDVSDVLFSIKLHHAIMNNRHLMQAFRCIFMLQKSDNSNMSNGEIINSSGFRVLCEALKSNVRTLETGEVLDALKTLSYLGVSSSSKLIQILLHILTKEINSLSLQQLLFFDFLLKDFTSSPTVEALRIALPVVIESNIKLKVDEDNMALLSDLLHYASRKNLSPITVNFLIDTITRKRRNIDFKSSKSIIRSLCDLKNPHEMHGPLLQIAINLLLHNIHRCTYVDFDVLISKLASRYSVKNTHFYHEGLLDAASHFIIANDCKFEEALWHLKKLMKFGHISTGLLDYIFQIVVREPAILKSSNVHLLFTLVGGFAQADYCPNWKSIEPFILENTVPHLDNMELPWVQFTRDLCTLNCWPVDVFCKLFSPEFLEKYLNREHNTLSHLQLLSIHSSLLSLCEWYDGPLMPSEHLNRALDINFKNNREYHLKKYIIKAFGCDKCILTGIMTRKGHLIDYFMIWRQEGLPAPISNLQESSTRTFVEDLPIFRGSTKLALFYVPANSYTSNTWQLKGPLRMMIDSVECTGITVIPISSVIWDQLLEHEKSPYILQQIRAKVSNMNMTTNAISLHKPL